ncbi:unnamed protein product [Merluccius merluccius]
MERQSSGVLVQRRSRQSYRSYVGSHLGFTPGFTQRRLTTSRVAAARGRRGARAPGGRGAAEASPAQLALLAREWQLSYVTPLYRFRHDQLRSYARQLGAFLAAETRRGEAAEAGLQDGLKVSITLVAGMAQTEEDPDAVFIQMHSKRQFAAPDDAPRLAWSGWLACVGGDADYLRSLPPDFVCLPLLGASGAEGLTALVKAWFRRTFDCCFGPLEINSVNLQWLAALWTDCHAQTSIQQLKLVWSLPVEPPLQVTYTVHPQDAWELWKSVRQPGERGEEEVGEEDGSIAIEEVARFIKGLQSHFYRHFRVELSAEQLTQVSTALGAAKHSGRLKISNSSYMITTLTLLTECALLKMPI